MSGKDSKEWKSEHNTLNWKNDPVEGFLSVIIPAYRDYKGLEVTLSSLRDQDLDPKSYEIIVANDGASSEITEIAKKYSATVVEISPNMGSYFARNRAIEISRGEFFALIDADIFAPPPWLSSGMKKLTTADYAAGNVEMDEKQVKTIYHLYSLHEFPIRWYLEELHFGGAGCLFLKRLVFEKAGGFDQRLRSSGDNEFGTRVFQSGFKQVFMESPSLIHPPRGCKGYKEKIPRTAKGFITLGKYYPDRYGVFSNRLNNLVNLLMALIPPSQKTFKHKIPNRRSFSTLKLYSLLWRIRISQAWCFFYQSFISERNQDRPISVSQVEVRIK